MSRYFPDKRLLLHEAEAELTVKRSKPSPFNTQECFIVLIRDWLIVDLNNYHGVLLLPLHRKLVVNACLPLG